MLLGITKKNQEIPGFEPPCSVDCSTVSMQTIPMKLICQEPRKCRWGILTERVHSLCTRVARSGAGAVATLVEQTATAVSWPRTAFKELLSAIGPPPRRIRVGDSWEQDAPLEYFWAINLLVVFLVAAVAFTTAAFVAGAEVGTFDIGANEIQENGSLALLAVEGSLRKLFSFAVMLGIMKCWSPLHSSLFCGL